MRELSTMGAHAMVLISRCGLSSLFARSRDPVLYVQYGGVGYIEGIQTWMYLSRSGLDYITRKGGPAL